MSHYLPPYPSYLYQYRSPLYPMYLQEPQFQEQNNPQSTYKQEVTTWLQSQKLEDLYKIFTINGQLRTIPILKMYIYDKICVNSCYALKQQTQLNLEKKIDELFMMKTKGHTAPRTEEFYDKLVIIDGEIFMDEISVTQPHLNQLSEFLALLDELSDRNLFSSQPKVTYQKIADPIWFCEHSFHSCAQWLIKEFEKNIAFHYQKQKEKKKKIKTSNQATINNNNIGEVKDYFIKHFANNKEKLTNIFQSLLTQVSEHADTVESIFYNNIFESPIMKLRIQSEQSPQFLYKLSVDQNVICSMNCTKMSELLEQKTYFLKMCYKDLMKEFKNYLEGELINGEQKEKQKIKKDKKKKKKKSIKNDFKKELDLIELNKRLSSKNLQEESTFIRFQRSFSHNNLQYNTPPNTPSDLEFFEDQRQSESADISPQQKIKQEKPIVEIEMREIKQMKNYDQIQFQVLQSQEKEVEAITDLAHSISCSLYNLIVSCVAEELSHDQQVLKQQRKLRKKQKIQEKQHKSEDEQPINSPQSEITLISQDSLTLTSHMTNCTASTSEEEHTIQPHTFKNSFSQKKNQNKHKLPKFEIPRVNTQFKKKKPKLLSEIKVERSSTNRIEEKVKIQQEDIELQIINQHFSPISEESIEKMIQVEEVNQLQSDSISEKIENVENEENIENYKYSPIQENLINNKTKEKLKIVDQQKIDIELQQEAKYMMIEQINKDITEYTREILDEYDEMLTFRLLAYERIKFVVKTTFQFLQVDIRLFGSCVTGLALLDSDIDIGVMGFEMLTKAQLQMPFESLYANLNRRRWITKSTEIFQSHIPVIKLEIDPLVEFNDYDGSGYLNLTESQIAQWKLTKQKLKQGIKVDITFNTYGIQNNDHLGYATTDMVQKWISQFPVIQQIVLILKTIIKKASLSEAYTGGLSSYALIIMVYCYLYEYNNNNNNNNADYNNVGEQFLNILNFYVNDFNPELIGIGLLSENKESMYFSLENYALPPSPIVIFSPLNQRLLSYGCKHIGKIIQIFREILENSQKLVQFYCEHLKMGKKKRQKQKKYLQNFIVEEIKNIKI